MIAFTLDVGCSEMKNFRPDGFSKTSSICEVQALGCLNLDVNSNALVGESVSSSELVRLAQKLIHARRNRRSYLNDDLFSEAGWEILLQLFCADAVGQPITISNLCASCDNPATTALRWIHKLLDCGFMKRRKSPVDARVVFIELEPSARRMMRSYLSETWRVFYS